MFASDILFVSQVAYRMADEEISEWLEAKEKEKGKHPCKEAVVRV